jgi:hypothetical protein
MADSRAILKVLLADLTQAIYRGFTYLEYLGTVDSRRDNSFSDRPSIDTHPQNSRFYSWTRLVDLLVLAWTFTSEDDPETARCEVERWRRLPFPVFQPCR